MKKIVGLLFICMVVINAVYGQSSKSYLINATDAVLAKGAKLKWVQGATGKNEKAAYCPADSSTITFTVNLEKEGAWSAWGRLFNLGGNNAPNSFLVSVDGGANKTMGNSKQNWYEWHWAGKSVETGTRGKLDLGTLTAGKHTLVIKAREPLAPAKPGSDSCFVDAIFLTQTDTFMVTEQKAYNGVAQKIPGKVEAELFDEGMGVGSWDADSGRAGGNITFRPNIKHVEFADWSGPSGGYGLGWIGDGESYRYTVDVAKDGKYNLFTGQATPNTGGKIKVTLDEVTVADSIKIEPSGDWNKWGRNSIAKELTLTKGTHVIRFYVLKSGFNLDYLDFVDPTVGIENEVVPTAYSLDQNYPNPFNPSTTIKFSLANSGLVSLKVFNVLGQEVGTLVNGQLNAGTHSYNFDASKLSSGIYIYTLTTGNFAQSRKMLLIK